MFKFTLTFCFLNRAYSLPTFIIYGTFGCKVSHFMYKNKSQCNFRYWFDFKEEKEVLLNQH